MTDKRKEPTKAGGLAPHTNKKSSGRKISGPSPQRLRVDDDFRAAVRRALSRGAPPRDTNDG